MLASSGTSDDNGSMSAEAAGWVIVGQGLAGTCLAWALWERGETFTIVDRGDGGSSRVAAGMINPVTGKNCEPGWRIAEFLPEALSLYGRVEDRLDRQIWYPLPVMRLAGSDKEWQKMQAKLDRPEVAPWVVGEVPPPDGWVGAVELKGGGRLDTHAFVEGSRGFFENEGILRQGDVSMTEVLPRQIRCEGAFGLMDGRYGLSRCAKGEILTVRAADWDDQMIRIGAGGWLVPLGEGVFKVGSTYEWNELDEHPTAMGRARVEEIASRLGGDGFEVIGHDAAVRPILRRSEPLIGPVGNGAWMFNGLGSKGSLYGPGVAARLADWLVHGIEPESGVDFREFSNQASEDVGE